jgi:hypothetical protein
MEIEGIAFVRDPVREGVVAGSRWHFSNREISDRRSKSRQAVITELFLLCSHNGENGHQHSCTELEFEGIRHTVRSNSKLR